MQAIWERARKAKARIVLPESEDQRVAKAARIALDRKLARPVLVGDRNAIEALASEITLDLAGIEVVDPASTDRLEAYSGRLYERRKHKGMSRDQARDQAAQPLYCGSLMVALGDAEGIVSGAATTSADVLRAYIHCLGAAEEVACASSAFLMVIPDFDGAERAMVFADPSVVPDPGPAELAAIAVASARTMKSLTGETPMVAMLSFSTKGSARHPNIDKVIEATRIAKESDPGLMIDGELQADAAIVPSVGARKAPESPVAGRANVLIFPNLDSANIGYKLVERLAKARAFGPLLQGLARPASDLSRGCSADDIVNTIAMTACQRAAS
jgi:phosphate acetyltransferase